MYVLQGLLLGILFGIPACLSTSLSLQRCAAYGLAAGLVSGLGSAFGCAVYGGIALVCAACVARWLLPFSVGLVVCTILLLIAMGAHRLVGASDPSAGEGSEGTILWLFFSSVVMRLSYPSTLLLYFSGSLALEIFLPFEAASWFLRLVGIFLGAFLWEVLLGICSCCWTDLSLALHRIQKACGAALCLAAGTVALLAGRTALL